MLRLARNIVAVIALSLLFGVAAQAQSLQQLPPDAMGIIKINNFQKTSQKIAAMAQRMGLPAMVPELADPLAALKKQLNIKQGFNDAGEMAVGIYEPAAGQHEPRMLILVPVTDFKAFMANMKDVKEEGGISSFTAPTGENVFAAGRGAYAAVSNDLALVKMVPGAQNIPPDALKQLNTNDVTAFVNVKPLAAKALPQLKQRRPQLMNQLEQTLNNEPTFNKKFTGTVKALANQVLNVAEGILEQGQAATIGMTFTDKGIDFTGLGEFSPTGSAADALKVLRNTDANLLAGMPDRKYFAFGGVFIDPQVAVKVMDDFSAPIVKELQTTGDDGKPILTLIQAARNQCSAMTVGSMGYVAPTGAPGQQALVQQVAIYTGDAKKMAASQKESMEGVQGMMKLLPKAPGMEMKFKVTPAAKTIDGVALDHFAVEMNVDKNTPEGQQAMQMMSMIYGGAGMSGYMGAVDDKTYLLVMSNDDALLAAAIASAKQHSTALAQQAGVKLAAAALPQNRAAVEYIALDTIIDTGVKYAAMFIGPVKVQLPPNLPPIGMTISTQGGTIRGDAHISSDLIDALFGAGMKMMMDRAAGGEKKGAI